jgi:hypothetical protein
MAMDKTRHGAVSRWAGTLVGVLALLGATLVSAGTARAESEVVPPAGKANWVVSVGGLSNWSQEQEDRDEHYRNWVRLGTYVFEKDGTVITDFWNFQQREKPLRTWAMHADCGGDVPTCGLRTVAGFGAQDRPTGGYRGVYRVVGDQVEVTWQRHRDGSELPRALVEKWGLQTGLAGGKAARIVSPTFYENLSATVTMPAGDSFSNYSATFGVGYGSNAPLDSSSRVPLGTLLTDDHYNKEKYRGAFVSFKVGKDGRRFVGREGAGGDWTFSGETREKREPQHLTPEQAQAENPGDPWRKCSGSECIGFLQTGTSCQKQEDDVDRVRYIGEIGSGRRNIEEYWCQGLAQGRECYEANSHARPMLQVIDDTGTFRGWVGVEAFTHVNPSTLEAAKDDWWKGYWGVFDMVSMSEMRPEIPHVAPRTFSKFDIPYGNSSTSGFIKWHGTALLVTFDGHNRVVSGCRYASFTAYGPGGAKKEWESPRVCTGDPDRTGNAANSTHRFIAGDGYDLRVEDWGSQAHRVQVTYWAGETREGGYLPAGTVDCSPDDARCAPAVRDGWPVTGFRLDHGASVGTGVITWYNQSASVSGNNRARSGCRYIEMTGFAENGATQRRTTSPLCSEAGADKEFSDTRIDFSSAGLKLNKIMVTYWASDEGDHSYATKTTQVCTRTGCVTDNAARWPETGFRVAHGASNTTGAITWYNQSASVSGNNHVTSGCRYTRIVGHSATGAAQMWTSPPVCGGTDAAFPPVKWEFPGTQISRFTIGYWASEDGGRTYATKHIQECTRAGCVTDNAADEWHTQFRLTYGASVGSGELMWSNRSVNYRGNNHVVSGCRKVEVTATASDGRQLTKSSSLYCSAGDRPFGGTEDSMLSFDQGAVGVAQVLVKYIVDDGAGERVVSTTCTRAGGCV